MALTIFRRHTTACVHKRQKAGDPRSFDQLRSDRAHRRCQCPIAAEGTLRLDGLIRRSTGETVWERAEEWKDEAERRGTLEPVAEEEKEDGPQPILEAIALFKQDQRARNLSDETHKKFRVLFDQLIDFAKTQHLTWMHELDVSRLTRFRATWLDTGVSAVKKLERLRSFFTFASLSGWKVAKPPAGKKTAAHALKPPKEDERPTMPYTRDQMVAILGAIHSMFTRNRALELQRLRLRLLILVMRSGGLAIVDAATLTSDRIVNGRLFLRRSKTGVAVTVKLPDSVVEGLNQLPLYRGRYFFWNKQKDDTKARTVASNWRRTIRKLLKAAKVEKPSDWAITHGFRDTFAVECLRGGVKMEQLQILLGHKSIETTQAHYAPWDPSRAQDLDASVARMHAVEETPLYTIN
jgi:site-specific recombinase XerD